MISDLWKSDVNWFATWFNTVAYHALYGERNEDEAILFIEALAKAVLGDVCSEVLDLGCGSGRHAAAFSNQGFRTLGIDLSSNSIDKARLVYGESESLRFLKGDMRMLEEHVEAGSFDAVASLFTSIGYFEDEADLTKTILGVARVLRINGVFILDFLNPVKVKEGLVEEEVKESGGYTFTIHRRVTNGWIEKSIQYIDSAGRRQHHVERVRALMPNDWRLRLEQVGMRIEAHFGDYDLNPWQEQAPRSILIARKKTFG